MGYLKLKINFKDNLDRKKISRLFFCPFLAETYSQNKMFKYFSKMVVKNAFSLPTHWGVFLFYKNTYYQDFVKYSLNVETSKEVKLKWQKDLIPLMEKH